MNIIAELYRRIDEQKLWDKEIVLKRNEYLMRQGSVETHLYYILSGSLKIYILDGEDEHIIRFGYQNNFITALDSFISEQPSDFWVQAIKKTEILAIRKDKYREFIQEDPQNRDLWYRLLEQLILQQLEREKDILTSSPQERYLRVLQRSPHLFQEIPQKYIASYLRMSAETLSRIQSKMRKS